jgi:hypothetical protein
MNENILYESISKSELEMIKTAIHTSVEKVCLFFSIDSDKTRELTDNLVVESKLFGHNSKIYIINFYNFQKILIGKMCLKYSCEKIYEGKLKIESDILNILNSNGVLCPKIINTGSNDEGAVFILMEAVEGESVAKIMLDIKKTESILDIIQFHELVLRDNLKTFQSNSDSFNLNKWIDFEKKLTSFLKNFAPSFIIKNSYGFINSYLNDHNIIKKTFATDRSVDNMFIRENDNIVLIDFSTIRIGTQFDNWIQFTEDPNANFSCTKEELIDLFFKKNNLQKNVLCFYYASSIYTNLLQGIFTYKKNPKLGELYIDNANESYKKFTKNKSVLIDIGH